MQPAVAAGAGLSADGGRRWRARPAPACAPRRPRSASHDTTTVRGRPTDAGGASTWTWSPCPDLDDALSMDWECAWVAVPLDRADPAGDSRRSPSPGPCSTPATTAGPLVVEPRRSGRVGHRVRLDLVDMLPPELLDDFYPVGWDPAGVGLARRRRSTADRSTPSSIPDVDECIERTGELLARRRRRCRRSTSRRCASRSASTASTTSATATARRSGRCTPWPTPIGSGTSCSTGRSTRPPATRRARSPPTACRTTRPTRSTPSIARFLELCDAIAAVRGRPGQRRARRRPRGHDPRRCRPPTSPAIRRSCTASTSRS